MTQLQREFQRDLDDARKKDDFIEFVIKWVDKIEELEKKVHGKSNVAPAHPTAAELRGMIALALCSFVFIQNLKASFGLYLLFLPLFLVFQHNLL